MDNKILTSTHPYYTDMSEEWNFYFESYNGGKKYFKNHLIKYYKEGDISFENRLKRAYRENYCKSIIDIINSYLFKESATRQIKDERLEKYFNNIDGHGKDINQFMKSASIVSSIFGRAYIVTDKTKLPESVITGTAKDDLKANCYSYIVSPLSVKDIAFDEYGKVKWALIEETVRNDDDPFASDLMVEVRYRLWTKTGWFLYDEKGGEIEKGQYNLGYPPITYIDTGEKGTVYCGTSLISDIAYIDKSIFNNCSKLDNIISEQTFSQLIFPIEGLLVQEMLESPELKDKFMRMAVGNILFYSAQAEAKPEYISPDASQAETILATIKHQIKQIYSIIGLQPTESGSAGSEYASGTSKQYDFDKLNKLLAGKADSIELAERQLVDIFNAWLKLDVEATINYPDEFDIRSLADEIILGEELMLLNISQTFNKTIQKNIALKALPKEAKETIDTVLKEIKDKQELSLEESLAQDQITDDVNAARNKKVQQLTQTKYRIQKNVS